MFQVPVLGDEALNLGEQVPDAQKSAMIEKQTDPTLAPTPYASVTDYSTVYPINLLQNTEILAMCSETNMLQTLHEEVSGLKAVTWYELNELAFTSGSSYISFNDGECPNEFRQNGSPTTVNLKHYGAHKSLSQSDILHSQTVAALPMGAINTMVGGVPANAGLPGTGNDTMYGGRESVPDIKAREGKKATVLVANGLDRSLIVGNSSTFTTEFDGIETQLTSANGAYTNDTDSPSGTFAAQTYDRFLASSCADNTHILGHPQAVQEMMSGYFQLGFAGSQLVNHEGGSRIVPGINYASVVNTGRGRKIVVSDRNFTRNDLGNGTFTSRLYGICMQHDGERLVYRQTQIPLQLQDLQPGCTTVRLQVYTVTALVIKHKCAHSSFSATFTGQSTASCPAIG